ncbi:hypothetical protein NGM99_21245 [Mesorhizobium sp. RP14(2022)]|uniref:Uncharacterized protein n=1 Tax=Mesorhizobium liriopis TaxID=2953882 RepID=A0ABT1CBX8_9HYPH|nr:hypothetical protein [Mesorhizobium liriopis]MCO6052319.1 hypothetical protein [Mesorhizobium liriopis]
MELLDEEPYAWHLLADGKTLYLNSFCSHSFFDYYFLMQLSEIELARFRSGGRDYLTKLAYDVHYSAPAVKGSTSRFKARNLTPKLGSRVLEALRASDAIKAGSD